jgi:ABC-type phosphate transport system substrate-binding protein
MNIAPSGTVVDANVAAVQSALNEVIDLVTSTYLGASVLNGNASGSWPMCMPSFVLVLSSTNTSDCTYIQRLLQFIAWSQLNPHAIDGVSELGYVPLPFGYKT